MRLRQIRLAGFKSFADPALILLERPVVGIVGPNGCGKSNIIDAVRWVLGEARVSELRGSASMKELIFAGSSGRRPMGRASVELQLINDDGRIKGAWGEYAELSVKRVVNADGQSTYFINNQQVRRRDVQDIFMGTGLGPRSYAIISQGMIDSFIKARPEELRVYLEEAAGVSLFRERRKETESLLSQTRSNLERVHDMQTVKEEEAARLEGEAALAMQWKALTAEKERAEALWYWIQFTDVSATVTRLAAEIAADEAAVEAKKHEAASQEAALPALEKALADAQAAQNLAAAGLRQAEKALTEAEAAARRRQERRSEAQALLAAGTQTIARKTQESDAAKAMLAANRAQAQKLEEDALTADEALAAAEEVLYDAEDAAGAAAARSTEAARRAADLRSRSQLASARAQECARRAAEFVKRLERLTKSEAELEKPDDTLLAAMQAQLEEAELTAEEARAAAEEAAAAAELARETREQLNEKYFSDLAREKETRAKLEALLSVQEKAEAAGNLGAFEAEEGLDALTAFADTWRVAPEWLVAAEAVLGSRARAKCLRMLESGAAYETRRPPAALSFADLGKPGLPAAEPLTADGQTFPPLLRFFETDAGELPRVLTDWFCGVRCAPDVKTALRARHLLGAGESFVTPAGDRITAAGLEVWAAGDPGQSMLSRRQEIERTREALNELEELAGSGDEKRRRAQAEVQTQEAAARRAADQTRAAEAQLARVRLEKKTLEERRAAAEQRLRDLQADRTELEDEKLMAQAQTEEAEIAADEAEVLAADAQKAAQGAQAAAEREAAALRMKRDAVTAAKHKLELGRVQRRELAQAAQMLEARLRELSLDVNREEERMTAAQAVLKETEAADDQTVQHEAVSRLAAAEKLASEAADRMEGARIALTDGQRLLREAQASVMPLTEALGVKKVERQMKQSLSEQFSQRLDELKADRALLAQEAAARPQKAQSLRARVTRLISEIAALGPVNHAALEHLEAVRKILAETAAQVTDLEKGIDTLENAIRRIDAETRERMRETFDEVNANFGTVFRELFGGGEAALSMTGEDILNAGVEVTAQPPGKRNAGVRLLSGGERAMAATALVFAIFKLNPAPFCLLDEVDAPLDEANQARLAGLCRSMSAQTQFLMITHHRVTMEFAGALIGVTMKEPGVSRVVSVDVESAVAMSG